MHEINEIENIMKNMRLELRKGTLVLSVLSQLNNKHYGYSLVTTLNDIGLKIDQNTLYPLLRRLDKQGLLDSTWEIIEPRPRKYYSLSALGIEVYEKLKIEYLNNHFIMTKLIKEVK
ncbi:PadR family transcriptional regulator [Candidatus Izimaplasma bacterium ZiA1]|uniref:PadR family transcriptional regulator n=1 Tax=Candidatus Izimoplasma sp. ZiA1 TaxID=2024899 RepID=UPI001F0A2ACB